MIPEVMVTTDRILEECKNLAEPEGELYRIIFTADIVVLAKDYYRAEKVAKRHISGGKHSWKQSTKIKSFEELGDYANSLPWCEDGVNDNELTCGEILKSLST